MFGRRMKKGPFGPGPWGGFGHDPRQRGRMFEKGDLKYIILDLLAEKPSHGYELIRALEERFRGMYSPSPGSVYPTLQLLEDMGHATAKQQDGKKTYEITAEGRKFLEENRQSVERIWGRVGGGWNPEMGAELHEMRRELMGLGKLFGREMHGGRLDKEKLRRIREIISGAARQVEEIIEERDDTGGTTSV